MGKNKRKKSVEFVEKTAFIFRKTRFYLKNFKKTADFQAVFCPRERFLLWDFFIFGKSLLSGDLFFQGFV